MKNLMYTFFIVISFSSLLHSQVLMEVDGSIKIASSQIANPEPGTIRWDGNDFLGWNGSRWRSLTTENKTGTVTDVEGNVYKTILIGNREWMAENLRTRRYRNGDLITLTGSDANWSTANFGAYCWFDNDQSNDILFGKLYNFHAVIDGRGLCPTGWIIPNENHFTYLEEHLGGASHAGGKLKEVAYWTTPNYGATNSSGFSALPGGFRRNDGLFASMNTRGLFWNRVTYKVLSYNSDAIETRMHLSQKSGFSVRCVKNE